MNFGEKLKGLREAKEFSQQQISDELGITKRSYAYYEANQRYPQQDMLVKIARLFGVSTDFLLTDEDAFLQEATDKYGYKAKARAKQLVAEANGLFAGGELSDDDREAFFKAMTEIYFESKERAKKYTPKKYIDEK